MATQKRNFYTEDIPMNTLGNVLTDTRGPGGPPIFDGVAPDFFQPE